MWLPVPSRAEVTTLKILIFEGVAFALPVALVPLSRVEFLIVPILVIIVVVFVNFLLSMTKGVGDRRGSIILAFIALNIFFMIILFARLYQLNGLVQPPGECGEAAGCPVAFWNAVYFSIITWTTVGYGDFSPTPSSRIFAATEALSGYLIMSLIISVLVAMAQNGLLKRIR
jgi:hypothetical protein